MLLSLLEICHRYKRHLFDVSLELSAIPPNCTLPVKRAEHTKAYCGHESEMTCNKDTEILAAN